VDAIAKDICVAFNVALDWQPAPIGHQKIPYRMIFNINIEDF
jgi:hypothetical protein